MAKGKFRKISKMNLAELDENRTLDSMIAEEEAKTASPEEEGPKVTDKMADPVGRCYRFDDEIMESELRSFQVNNAFRQPMVYIVMLMGIAFGVYFAISNTFPQSKIFGLIVGIVVVTYTPLSLVLKAKGTKKRNKTFQEIFHFMLDEKGFHLQLDKEAIDVEWKYFKKAMYTKNCVVIYTSKVHGYIIPYKGMKEQKDEILAFIKEKIQ